MQAKGPEKPKEEKDEVDESKFDEFMGNDAGESALGPPPPNPCCRLSTIPFVPHVLPNG